MRITRHGLLATAMFSLVVVVAAGCSSDSGSDSKASSTTTTKAKATTTTTRPGDPNAKLSSDEIKQVQTNLHSVGCFSGAVDGVIGPITRAGISAFQKAEGLTVDGQYGAETKSKLSAAVAANKTVCTTPTTTTTQAGQPPCTSTVIAAALPNYKVLDFGCDAGWAWAGIDTGPPDGYESVALLKANGMTWQQVDRATYCVPASNIPPDIYQPACTVS